MSTKKKTEHFSLQAMMKQSVKAKKVVLAVGYHNVYPDIPGLSNVVQIRLFAVLFVMVTNRDSVWSIVVNSNVELERLPGMAHK
jgi:thioredoxin reductase